MKIKRLLVTTPQGESGVLDKESRFVFNYGSGDRAREVSLTMPIRAESYASGALLMPFAMNKPEGWLYRQIVERMAKHEAVDDMRLLAIVGSNQIGRLSNTLPGESRTPTRAQNNPSALRRWQSTHSGRSHPTAACNRTPSARVTLRMVAKSGLRAPESAL